MSENTLILCGGTGAHVGVAFLRLHTLGYALGFFDRGDGKNVPFPEIFLVDQDAGDGAEGELTAWQEVRRLLEAHPGRLAWTESLNRGQKPDLVAVTPLPIGERRDWFRPPFHKLASRFAGSPLLPLLTSKRQREIEYSQGMMASPALGALLFKLKHLDRRDNGLNRDESYGALLANHGRHVVAGSGVGGTGAAVGPTLAQELARDRPDNRVLAVMLLEWFELDEEDQDLDRRRRAAHRNRLLRENANSALEYCGQNLLKEVAALALGMPERAHLKRAYTSDAGQPLCESFLHAAGALAALLHFRRPVDGYAPGLYVLGAVEPGRLDGRTAIPGATLQGLANQAATLVEVLGATERVLSRRQQGRFVPAIYEAVDRVADPGLVAAELGREAAHYRQQLEWMERVLGVRPEPSLGFTREAAGRYRLVREGRGLEVAEDAAPAAVALAVFHWAARWIRERASESNGLVVQPGPVGGAHLPTPQPGNVTVSARGNGELTRVPDANVGEQLRAFVDRRYLHQNGWPHPLAAVDFFARSIEQSDPRAVRQLQLLLVGSLCGQLALRPTTPREQGNVDPVSLEQVVADLRYSERFEGLARYAIVDPSHGDRLLGFSSPFTLLCPVPPVDDDDGNAVWSELWQRLSGSPEAMRWVEVEHRVPWNEDAAVRRLRVWLERQRELWGGDAPPWARVMEGVEDRGGTALYGTGESLPGYWGASGGAGGQRLIELSLPTASSEGRWEPPPGTPEIAASDLLVGVPELLKLRQDDGETLFERVEIELPAERDKVWGLWEDHLQRLQRDGKILAYGAPSPDVLRVGVLRSGRLSVALLPNTRLLNRRAIEVTAVTPLAQVPVPGSRTSRGSVRFPDLPIRSDYLDLVLAAEGTPSLLELSRRGEAWPAGGWQPRLERDERGLRTAVWDLWLRGRSTPLPIRVPLPEAEPHKAHWMVWPRFRDRTGHAWRAYYLYEHCSVPKSLLDVLWLDPGAANESPRLRRRRNPDSEARTYPLSFNAEAQVPVHTGGPPVALALRGTSGEEQGLYLVPLEVLPSTRLELRLALDFGTSHSVVAYRAGEERSRSVPLAAELGGAGSLSLHVSEDFEHVSRVLLPLGSWLPTYRQRGGTVLPSELLLVRSIAQVQASDPQRWQPLRDFTIPPMDISRDHLGDFLLTDFKWPDPGSRAFRGREQELREHYLGLLCELALADLVAFRANGFPSETLSLTFTYPLRSSETQVTALQQSLQRVVERCRASLGVPLALHAGLGLYDESRAARVSSEEYGEVAAVADLGGGTLDLFISATDFSGLPLAEVADSVRLGGNLLLRRMAEKPEMYLPRDGGWGDDTETKLRAWMRAMGSARLFGNDAADRPELAELGLSGFERPADAERTRRLLDRYFRLVGEYIARQLAGYLLNVWYPAVKPADYGRLRVTVQLRGNGWRLRYQRQGYEQAAQDVQNLVRQRVLALWPPDRFPAPESPGLWIPAERFPVEDPKAEPIRQAVGKSMAWDEARRRSMTHTLVELEVLRDSGQGERVPWHRSIPFSTGGSSRVEMQGVAPVIPLSGPEADAPLLIAGLDAPVQGDIHRQLKRPGNVDPSTNTYTQPVAPVVWEAVFGARQFWPHEGGGAG